PSYYREIRLAPSSDDPRRLVFIAPADAPKAPDEMVLLRQDYERTARVTAVLFEDEIQIRKDVFDLLHQSADRGLRGPAFNIEDGRANLVDVRERIVDHAHPVRSKLLRQYTILAIIVGVVPLLFGALVERTGSFGLFSQSSSGQTYDPLFVWIVAA